MSWEPEMRKMEIAFVKEMTMYMVLAKMEMVVLLEKEAMI